MNIKGNFNAILFTLIKKGNFKFSKFVYASTMIKILLFLIIYQRFSDLNVQSIEIDQLERSVDNGTSIGSIINKHIGDKSAERDELKVPLTRERVLKIIDNLPDINIPENYTTVLCAMMAPSGYGGQKAIGKAYMNDTAACFSVCYQMDECIGINVIYQSGICLFYNNETYSTNYNIVIPTYFYSKVECTDDMIKVQSLIERNDIAQFNKTNYDSKIEFSCETSYWNGFCMSTEPLGVTVAKEIDDCLSMCHAYNVCRAVNYISLTGHCYFLRETIKSASDLILRAVHGTFIYFHVPEGCENGTYTCQPNKIDDNITFPCGIPDSSHKPSIGDMASRHRIFGGSEANAHSYPWMVSLHSAETDEYHCGGVLLPSAVCSDKSDIVLTAGHCVKMGPFAIEPQEIDIYLGKHNLSQVENGQFVTKVKKIITHPRIGLFTGYDFALLQLSNPVTFSQYVQPVCLPMPDASPSKPKSCTVAGWGRLNQHDSAVTLQQIIDPVINNSFCATEFEKNLNMTYDDNASVLCAGNLVPEKGICRGDSGSPLVCYEDGHYTVYGLVSHGTGYGTCNVNGTPTVYSRVSTVIDWINFA